MRGILPLILVLLLLGAAAPAAAQGERITAFSSDIAINRDGALNVRETIAVNVEGKAIRRGIFRDFPTLYTDSLGRRVRVGFEVERVTRNGRDEPYAVERIPNGRRVRIGQADVLLDHGIHTYTIDYVTTRQIGFFEDHDELYWNVTGNGWAFAIDAAEAMVRLPGGEIERFDYFTGPQGAEEKEATATQLARGTVIFNTTDALQPGEGLTIVVGFAKGIVMPPGTAALATGFLRDNASSIAALAGLFALFAFYFAIWREVGRDPERGTIIPLFEPPERFSAAAVRFVRRMGYDRKAFAAALVSMAVKGYLRILEADGVYTLVRTGKNEQETGLSKGERAISNALFSGKDEIELKNDNHEEVSSAITRLQTALRREDEGVYFVTNRGWFYLGLVILVSSAIATTILSDQPAALSALFIPLSLGSAFTAYLVHRAVQQWRGVAVSGGARILDLGAAMFATLFVFPIVGSLTAAITMIDSPLPRLALAALVAQGVLAFVFYRLLKAPTAAGARVLDEIEGFRMFLSTTERERLEVLHPPHVTPEVFEKFLPYAIALDAENAWSRKFEAEAAAAGIEAQDYRPGWYGGSSFRQLGTNGFASSIGGAVAAATASAAMAPGRSSGFGGGGGFSGGGGGGGGGGGW